MKTPLLLTITKIINMVHFNYIKEINTLICDFHGRLGADNSQELNDSIQNALDEYIAKEENNLSLKVQFDMKAVSYIASSFIRISVAVAKQIEKGNFSIINTSPMIKKTFKIAGLDEILNVA